MLSESEPDSRARPASPWSIKQVVRIVIAIVVIIGLALATRKAVQQWNRQAELAAAQATEIQKTIDQETDAAKRQQLLEELERADQSIPRLSNLNWGFIAIAAVLYGVGLLPGGIVLQEAVAVFGQRVTTGTAIGAQIVGHLGKYVPGKAMVVVIRAGRLSSRGVPVLVGSVAVFMETLLMMAVGASLSGGLIYFLPVPKWIAVSAMLGGVAASVPTLPPIFDQVMKRLNSKAEAMGQLRGGWRFFAAAWIGQSIAWVFIGASFAFLVASIPGALQQHSFQTVLIASSAAIALAMVVGFASLLPGGAGIRELTLAVVLAPIVGESQALLGAIAARLLFIAVELLAAGVVVAMFPASQAGEV